jgi:hypothetical protein
VRLFQRLTLAFVLLAWTALPALATLRPDDLIEVSFSAAAEIPVLAEVEPGEPLDPEELPFDTVGPAGHKGRPVSSPQRGRPAALPPLRSADLLLLLERRNE